MVKFWLLVLLLLFSVFSTEVLAETLVVDQSGGVGFLTIRKAVNVAGSGDEILVRPGYYREGEIPIRQQVSIVGVPGQVILEGGFVVGVSGFSISGFDIRGFGRGTGVELKSFGNTILGCTIRNFSTGVLSSSSDNQIFDSVIEGCTVGAGFLEGSGNQIGDSRIRSALGVEISGSQKSEISNCTFSGKVGVSVANSCDNAILGSVFSSATGIKASDSERNLIGGNDISSSEAGIILERSEQNVIRENEILGSKIAGVLLLNSSKNEIRNSSARGCAVGIRLKDSAENRIENNLLKENEVAGIRLETSTENAISGNLFLGNGEGLSLRSGSSENGIEDNEIVGNGRGLTLLGSGFNVLRANRMDLNQYAVRVDWEDPSTRDDGPFRQDFGPSNVVDGRPVCYLVDGRDLKLGEDCGLLGLVGCKNVTAEGLVLTNNSDGALIVNSTSCAARNITLYGNEAGVRMLNAEYCRIEESRADNCTVGFRVEGGRGADLLGCIARSSSESGFEIEDSEDAALKGLEALENLVGISLLNSSSCTILRSDVIRNRGEGVRLIRSSRCTLNQNTAFENRVGIRASGSDGVMVIRNEISSNYESGLVIDQLSTATVSGNTANGNGDGIFLQAVVGGKIEGNNLSINDRYGLRMSYSRDGKVAGNSFVQNGLGGASLIDCSGCSVYHNNFIDNGNRMLPQNAVDNGDNEWDAGPVVGGNYWSDHQVVGNPGSDPKNLPSKGMDRYPFQDPDGWK